MSPHRLLAVLVIGLTAASLNAQTLEPRPLFVEGYANHVSYAPGDEVVLHVSTSAAKYSLEIAVRASSPGQTSKALIQLATNTYNAYNN